MFEKEAEEILNNHCDCDCELLSECMTGIRCRCSDFEESKKLLIEGIEFGYNKANEWHYVKDGDLPSDKHGHVVINQDWDKVTIRNGRFEHLDGGKADVVAWKEIVPPKEAF